MLEHWNICCLMRNIWFLIKNKYYFIYIIKRIIENQKNGYLLPVDFLLKDLANVLSNYFDLSLEERIHFQNQAIATWKTKFHGLNNFKALKSVLGPKNLLKKLNILIVVYDVI